ncbi:hypothetical protein [Allosphingosinicella sp.]|jgi:hypothetical protein|uniref:hypothetical protein n=1 Tax=Allosphingosinicella sp. TaxID=2823234 RepID=UPI002EEFD042
MRLAATLLAAAAILLVPAAASAQLELEAPEAEAQDPAEALAQVRAAVAEMRAQMFRPGEKVEGWDVGGADPDSELKTLGADRNFFVIRSDLGHSVIILSDRRIASFAPADWRIADSYGSAVDAVEKPFIQFSWLSPRYVIATRANGFRRNGVDCTDRTTHALLYEVPGEEMTEEDEQVPILFRLGLLATEEQTFCTRYEGDRSRGWRMRAFLPDGHRLPALDRPQDLLTIVPAGPLDTLMVRPAPAAASAAAASAPASAKATRTARN